MTEKNAAEQDQRSTEEQLFDNMNFDGMDDLIMVDVPEEELPDDIQEDIDKGGSGDSPDDKGQDPPGDKGGEKGTPEEKDDSFIVDKGTPAAEKETKKESSEDDDKAKEGTGAKSKEENLSPMYLHAAALHENGLLPDFDLDSIKELKTEEQALKINEHIQTNIDASIKEGLDAELAKLGEAKQIYDDIQAGVDPEALRENASLETIYGGVKVSDLEDNEENQEAIYADYLSMKGLSDDKIKQLVEVAKEKETLLTEATDGLKEIQKEITSEREQLRKQAQEQKEKREKSNKETQEKIQTVVSETKEIIPGKTLTEAEHKQLVKDMTVPIKFVDNGQGQKVPVSRVMELRSKDPIAFEMKLNYFISQGLFDDKPNLDKLMKTAETNASKEFLRKMKSDKPETTGDPHVQSKGEKKEPEFRFPFATK